MFRNEKRPRYSYIRRGRIEGMQLLDLLQLSREEKESKERAILRLRELKNWERALELPIHPRILPYARARTIALRRQARKAVHNYRQAKQGRIEIFRHYIDSLPNYGFSKRLVS